MPWDCEQTILGSERTLLPCNFTSSVIAIDITASNQKPTWYRSGFLRAILDIDGQPFIGANIETAFGQQVINLPFATYQIDFAPRVWLNQTTIRIKQLTTTQIVNIMPLSIPDPASVSAPPITDSIPTSFSATQFLAEALPTAYQALPENLDRKGFSVTNIGTKPVYLDLDAPTSTTKRLQSIPAGSNYISDFNYVGPVYLWSSTAGAQACEVRELI